MGLEIWGLGFGVRGLRFGVWGVGSEVWSLGSVAWGSEFGAQVRGVRSRNLVFTGLSDPNALRREVHPCLQGTGENALSSSSL